MKISNDPSFSVFGSLLGQQLEEERKLRDTKTHIPTGFIEAPTQKKRGVSTSLLRSLYKPNRPYKVRAIEKMLDKDDDEDPQKSILKRRLIEKLKSKI